MNKLMQKIQDVLMPIGNKIGNQKHLSSISAGIITTVPLTIIGAIFTIIANPPVTKEILANHNFFIDILRAWSQWATANASLLNVPIQMTTNMLGLVVSFTVAYQLAQKYELEAMPNGICSLVTFLMVASPIVNGNLSSTYLGSSGLFVAIIVALITVEIAHFCDAKHFEINFGKDIPPMVNQSFKAIVPLALDVVILYGANVACKCLLGSPLPEVLMSVLTPAIGTVSSPLVIIGMVTFGLLLWVVGIHGLALIAPIIFTLLYAAAGVNADLIAAGKAPVFNGSFLFHAATWSGSGLTLGLVILMLRSKSKQLNAIGKIGILPSIFGINEPVIFGTPVTFNPIIAVPFILAPVVSMFLTWLAYAIGLLTPYHTVIIAYLPIGLDQFLMTGSVINMIWPYLMLGVSMIIYYPFFKVYENQLIEESNRKEVE